jgi:uncharacterized membrane protein
LASQKVKELTQEKAEIAIAAVLRYGARISTLIMAIGVVLVVWHARGQPFPPHHPIRFAELMARLVRGDPEAITEAGVLMLLFTPLARIVVAVVSFALERDSKYVLISLGVLAVVLLSISFAIEG